MRPIRLLWLMLLLVPGPAQGAELAEIIARGSVRIGVCLGREPMGFRDSNNQPRGYNVDVATLAAEALGLPLELVEVNANALRASLVTDQFDFAACGITVTPRRARDVDFSLPYLHTGLKLLVPRRSPLGGLADIVPGTRVVVMRDTTAEALVHERAPRAEVIYVGNPSDALLMLRQGQAEVYVEDAVGVDYLAGRYPEELRALPEVYSSDAIGLLLAKGHPELLRWLDIFASTYVSSGDYAATYAKWWDDAPPPITAPW